MTTDVMGAKLALFLGDALAVILRDDKPGLLWANHWDLPGGGLEGDETPLSCALRETQEELSLVLRREQVSWGRPYINSIGRTVWFFAAHLPFETRAQVRLGDEGQRWATMGVEAFLSHDQVVPQFKPRLRDYLSGRDTETF